MSLTLELIEIGGSGSTQVSVESDARVADVLVAAGYDGYSAVLLHGAQALSLSATLHEIGIAAGSHLTIVKIPAESLSCLTVTGIGWPAYKILQEGLTPIELAYCGGDARCFYTSSQEAEDAKNSEVVRNAIAAQMERQRELRLEHPRICFAAINANVQSCKSDHPGVASYHLDGLRAATEEGALNELGASYDVTSKLRESLKSFVVCVEQIDDDAKDLSRRQAEQVQAAELQLRILDAKQRPADAEADLQMEDEIQSLRALLNLIVRGLLLLHVDRFAETLESLGQVTGVEALTIDTE